MPLGGLLEPLIRAVKSRMRGDGAGDLVLGPSDLLLALIHLENRLLQLRLEFRNLEDRKRLPLVHNVADVNVDLPHVAADLGVHVDNLVGLELAGKRKHVRDVAPLGPSHPCRRNGSSSRIGTAGTGMTSSDSKYPAERTQGDERYEISLAHSRVLLNYDCSSSRSRKNKGEDRDQES